MTLPATDDEQETKCGRGVKGEGSVQQRAPSNRGDEGTDGFKGIVQDMQLCPYVPPAPVPGTESHSRPLAHLFRPGETLRVRREEAVPHPNSSTSRRAC